jgi:pimeloyl-ACP methyl ester carboxylesterase
MTTFVLLPGAGGSAWYWSLVVPLLEGTGHRAIAVDLPGDDEDAGLREYTRLVVDAIGESIGVALVAQSLGGFTAAMVTDVASVGSLTLVNAMIPVPHETPGEWWEHTGALDARAAAAAIGGYGDFDLDTYFLHDVPPEVVAEGEAHQRPEADAVFTSRCEFTSWPSVPIRVLVGSDDRFFPAEFQRRVARERLGVGVDVLPGGHLIALAHPAAVADYLCDEAQSRRSGNP